MNKMDSNESSTNSEIITSVENNDDSVSSEINGVSDKSGETNDSNKSGETNDSNKSGETNDDGNKSSEIKDDSNKSSDTNDGRNKSRETNDDSNNSSEANDDTNTSGKTNDDSNTSSVSNDSDKSSEINYDKVVESNIEILPLITLKELITWNGPENAEEILCSVPDLMPSSERIKLTGKIAGSYSTLVCHDYNNGYLDDRFCYGTRKSDNYKFYHWYGLDIFVYFSHNFVTIPPCGWVTAAHTHGVQVLGTFITEWDEGTAIWKEILSSPSMTETVIDQLVAITKAYHFDGWLINVENRIPPNLINKLINFVKQLKKQIYCLNEKHKIIWFDAVTIKGELNWQDRLTNENRPFFDSCDGIFLNYGWNISCLKASARMAGKRKHSVYAGIDMYGRSSKSGGGYNSNKALEYIREVGVSAAIFGITWLYDKFGKENDFYTSNLFWNKCKPYLLFHGFKNLPFKTSFCQGAGSNYYAGGKVVKKGKWYNLMKQQAQPLWQEFDYTVATANMEHAYNGGSIFTFWCYIQDTYRLMLCEFELNELVQVKITYKLTGNFYKFAMNLETKKLKKIELFCESKDGMDGEISLSHTDYLNERINETDGEWKVSMFQFNSLGAYDTVTSIHIQAEGSGLISLGEISFT